MDVIYIKAVWSSKIGDYYYVDSDGNVTFAVNCTNILFFNSQKQWNATFYHVLHAIINKVFKSLVNNETDIQARVISRAWYSKKVILTCYDEHIHKQVLNIITENKDNELEVSAEYKDICSHKENNIIDFRLDDLYDAFNAYFNCTIEWVR